MVREIVFPKILQPWACYDMVRLGKDNDGGYLVNKKDVKLTNFLFSFGIGTDTSFEKDFANCKWNWNTTDIAAFDASVDNPDPFFFKDNRKFHKKNVGKVNDDTTVDVRPLLEMPGRLFIKCDIDGGEYALLDDFIHRSHDIVGMVIEFHDLGKYENFNLMTDFIARLRGLKLLHIHINNYSYYDIDGKVTPDVLELTFGSSGHIALDRSITLPHKLDMPNNPDGEDFLVRF